MAKKWIQYVDIMLIIESEIQSIMMYQTTVNNELETQEIAQKLAKRLALGDTLSLSGPLGSGKTTFTRYLAKALGVKSSIKSPTYTIIKGYPLQKGSLIHMDAYRLEETGADAIDMEAIFQPDTITIIEWGQFIEDQLPASYLEIDFRLTEDFNRRQLTISLQGDSKHFQSIIQALEADKHV